MTAYESESERENRQPVGRVAASSNAQGKRGRTAADIEEVLSLSPNTRRTKASPNFTLDKMLRYLPVSTLGPHAGAGRFLCCL